LRRHIPNRIWRRCCITPPESNQNSELDAAVVAIGSRVTAIQGDVTKLGDLDRLYLAVKADKGKLDVVFANAAIARGRSA
jgi:NAD(P)-dependent dehydrogenase (short-subunit alcohol dehydrogenase family)